MSFGQSSASIRSPKLAHSRFTMRETCLNLPRVEQSQHGACNDTMERAVLRVGWGVDRAHDLQLGLRVALHPE